MLLQRSHSRPASVITSSENPLHSPSDSEFDPDDVADLLSEEDGFDGAAGGADSCGLEDTGKFLSDGLLLSDSLLEQNPLVTPSDSPETSDLGNNSGGGAETRRTRVRP
jgi:hypothetical protein